MANKLWNSHMMEPCSHSSRRMIQRCAGWQEELQKVLLTSKAQCRGKKCVPCVLWFYFCKINNDQKALVCVHVCMHGYTTIQLSVKMGKIHIRLLIWVIWVDGWVGNQCVWKRKRGTKPKRRKQKDHPHMTTHLYLCWNWITYVRLWKCMCAVQI